MGQGVVWFAKDKEHLITDLHGASVGTGPVYLYTCKVLTNKTAGWDEYEKIGIGELIRSGYDSVELEDDVVCLEPKNIKILQRKQIK